MIKTKILIVDDKHENIEALQTLISSVDVEILSATSGVGALDLILDHEFALAMIDVQMPGMSGFELAKLMRGAECSRQIPIIFVNAARQEKAAIFEGYEQGAVDFMLKPLDPHIVRSKVRVFVELDQFRKLQALQLEEMKQLKMAAEEASRVKSRFLANMSHEIRTPLGAVLGFAQLLQTGSESDNERRELVEAILRNGKLLSELIDDILDISKIEAGRLKVERIQINLEELLEEVEGTFGRTAKQKNLQFSVTRSPSMPQTITSDPFRMKQILNNVIGNAIKFTDRGEITVSVSLEQSGSATLLRADVRDTGCGLDDEKSSRIFKPFAQADTSTSRRFGGTGLGLSISKHLAQALGGDLVLLGSKPGQGSTFSLTVDASPVSYAAQVASIPHSLPGRKASKSDSTWQVLYGFKILVVDDIPDNVMLIERILKVHGAEVDSADNGIDGIKMAVSRNYDLILMDVQMPKLDGLEATLCLRDKGYRKPIIALTAHAMQEERQRCFEVGCNDHVAKPVDQVELIQKIRALIRNHPGLNKAGQIKKNDDSETIKDRIAVSNDSRSHVNGKKKRRSRHSNDHHFKLAEIVETFMQHTYPQQLTELKEALTVDDFGKVASISHVLKGSVGVYKYPNLGEIATRLEHEAKEGRDYKIMEQCLRQLESLQRDLPRAYN